MGLGQTPPSARRALVNFSDKRLASIYGIPSAQRQISKSVRAAEPRAALFTPGSGILLHDRSAISLSAGNPRSSSRAAAP